MARARASKGVEAPRRHAERGDLDAALAATRKVVEADPGDAGACAALSDICTQAEDAEGAGRAYVQAALAHVEAGELDDAIAMFRDRVLPAQPGSVNARLRLGELYRRKGMLPEALSEHRAAARVFEQQGRDADAAGVLGHVLTMDPEDVASRVRLAEVHGRLGDAQKAAQELLVAGGLLKAANRLNEYLRVAERVLHHQPDNLPVLRDVVGLCLDIGRPHKALARIRRRLQTSPGDPDALELLVRTFDELKEPRKEVDVLREIARIHERDGQTSRRDQALRRVRDRAPGDPGDVPVVELDADDIEEMRIRTRMPAAEAEERLHTEEIVLTDADVEAGADDLVAASEATQEVAVLGAAQLASPAVPAPSRQPLVAEGGTMDGQAHFDLGITYREMGLSAQAEGEFLAALAAGFRRAECHRLLGMCRRDGGDVAGAADWCRRGLGLRDGGASALASLHFELADLVAAGGNREAAAAELEEVRCLDPRYPGLGARPRELGLATGPGT